MFILRLYCVLQITSIMLNASKVNRNILMKLIPAKLCAVQLKLNYHTFLWRVRKKKLQAERYGHAVYMTPAQLKKAKRHAHH